jgi:response regulator RpfG family c-di-GMP phosphodiesterase
MSDFLFGPDDTNQGPSTDNTQEPWKILIIDDEPDIHQITKLVLSGLTVDERPLEFISAYSGKEAREILQQQDDIAVALVDVVMETTNSGLEVIKYIRQEINNRSIRLVLRTGQPGEAPEESVIRDYDINDYKNKTELTDIKLKTMMYATIRSYRDIMVIQSHKAGLESIIDAMMHFLNCDSINQFASSLLSHVANILKITEHQIVCCVAYNEVDIGIQFNLLAASGDGMECNSEVPKDIEPMLVQAHNEKKSVHLPDHFVGYLKTGTGRENYLYVSRGAELNETEHDLLEFFAHSLAVAYDNIYMREMVKQSQKEISYIIGEAVERRSKETGSHVKRVAHYSYMMAIQYGLSEFEADVIRLASPLHDVGKIAIPDNILNKPAKLDDEEWAVMQTHAQIGQDIFKQSQNEILQMGAIIAGQHHEKWDGSGYPNGLQGEDIHIAGRITALADVFDALASDRCYKPAWPMDKVLALLNEQSGQHFEPKLVQILMNNLEDYLAVRDLYPDL